MSVLLRAGGAFKTVTGAKVRVNGAWRNIVSAKCFISGAWKTVGNFTPGAGAITLALSPSPIHGFGRNSTVTTAQVRATPTGGLAPYTYAWTKQSGGVISATNPTSAITTFQATAMVVDEVRSATFRCTCTDNFGNSDSEDVAVSLTRLPPLDRSDSGSTV